MQKKSVPSASNAARAAIRTSCKFALAAVAMSLSATCLAATVTFPSTGYDLASAEDWGGTMPGTGDLLKFTTSATVTASNDVEFAGLYVGAEDKTIVFDMRDAVSGGSPRRIKMNGNAYILENTWKAKYVLRGGFWDFSGKSVCAGLDNDYSGNNGTSATIDGGAVVICDSLAGRIGQTSSMNYVSVIGQGTVVTAKTVKVAQYTGKNNRFAFTDGAKVVLAGTGSALSLSAGDTEHMTSNGNSLRIADGALLEQPTAGGTHTVGNAGKNNTLSVEDGGSVFLKGNLTLAYSDDGRAISSSGNRISVSGAGSRFVSTGEILLGRGNASSANSNNVISVSDGAVFTNAAFRLRGHDNGIVISNATMRTTAGGIECIDASAGTATNCFVRLQGRRPQLVLAGTNPNCNFRGSFRFEYDIPEEGYETVPVTLNEWARMAENTEFVVNGILELFDSMRKRGVKKVSYALLKANGGLNTNPTAPTAAMLERWNAQLPAGASLSYANNTLTLTVKLQQGIILFIL